MFGKEMGVVFAEDETTAEILSFVITCSALKYLPDPAGLGIIQEDERGGQGQDRGQHQPVFLTHR